MPSPFSQQMLDNLNKLTENLGTAPIPAPESYAVATPSSPKNGGFIANLLQADYSSILKISGWRDPKVILLFSFVLIFSLLLSLKKKIWKKEEDRPSTTKIFLWALLVFIPVFLFVIFKKRPN